MSDILLAEYTLKRALREHTMDLIQTSSPHLFCTPLPKHWRSNKSLPNQFRVVSLITIPDGTRVSVSAGNEDRPYAELKNPVTVMHGNEARFSDLRFLGRSGRGKSFNLTITVETNPPMIAVYARAIKVTVDGPRVPRNKYSTPRAMKMMKEHRRLTTRHNNSFDQNRFCRGSTGRAISYVNDSIRNTVKRNSTVNSSKEAFSTFKTKLGGRIPYGASNFGLTAPPCTMGSGIRSSKNAMDTAETLSLSLLNSGRPLSEKSPSSSDNSLPSSFGTKPDTNVQFSPFESTYLLSSINEAYAKLLSRQMNPQNNPAPLTNPDCVTTTRAYSSGTAHSVGTPTLFSSKYDADISTENRTPNMGRLYKDNEFKIGDNFPIDSNFQRSITSNLSSLFTQSRPINPVPGNNFLQQANIKIPPDSTTMAVLSGTRPIHLNGSQLRTTPLSSSHQLAPVLPSFPFTAFNSPVGPTYAHSYPQPTSTISTSSHVSPNPYESSFYGILGAIFTSWVQRNTDRKVAGGRSENTYLPQTILGGYPRSGTLTSELDRSTDEVSPMDLVARTEDKSKHPLHRPTTTESVESSDSILSIEKLLNVPSSQAKEENNANRRGIFTEKSAESMSNPFRFPFHPFNAPELAVLSNAFGKHLKDQSFRA